MGKLITFSIFFILFNISNSYGLDGCKEEVMNTDDIPCLLLLSVSNNTNCNSLSVDIKKENITLINSALTNYSSTFCSVINNFTTIGTYNAEYSTGDTADWVVEGGNKMIWILYLAIAVFFILFVIGLVQKDANLGAISGIGFFCVGLFLFLLIKGTIVVSGLTLESNLLTESLAIIVLGFGMFVMGNAWEEWFNMFG